MIKHWDAKQGSIIIDHGTIMQTEQHVQKFLYKNLLSSVLLWSKACLTINKTQKYLSVPQHQLARNWILIFDFYQRTENNKSQFITKFIGIIFMCKSLSDC